LLSEKNKNIAIILLLIIFFFITNDSMFSQGKNEPTIWGSFGVGSGFYDFSDSDVGFQFTCSLNYENGNNNFSLSYLEAHEFVLFRKPYELMKSIEFKYGKSKIFSLRGLLLPFPFLLLLKHNFNYSVIGKFGVSLNNYRYRVDIIESYFISSTYDQRYKNGFGFPLEIELREEFADWIGMGILFYYNINTIKNFFGAGINFQFGDF